MLMQIIYLLLTKILLMIHNLNSIPADTVNAANDHSIDSNNKPKRKVKNKSGIKQQGSKRVRHSEEGLCTKRKRS